MLTFQEQHDLSQELFYLLVTTFPHPKYYLLNHVWFILVKIVSCGCVKKEDALYSINALVLISYYEDIFKIVLKNGSIDLCFTQKLVSILLKAKEDGYWNNDYKLFNEELEQMLKLKHYEFTEGINESNYNERLKISKDYSQQSHFLKILSYGLNNSEEFCLSLHESLLIYLSILDIEEGKYTIYQNQILQNYFNMFENHFNATIN
jgi:hypothetical protein